MRPKALARRTGVGSAATDISISDRYITSRMPWRQRWPTPQRARKLRTSTRHAHPTDQTMTQLADYARDALRGEGVYKGYRPRAAMLERIAHDLPQAHVVVVSGSWCGDCRREVPKLARIMELLPATWTTEL